MALGLTMKDLTLKKEKTYFNIIRVFAIIAWVLIGISIVGIAYGLFFALMMWLANGLFVAHLRSECVEVNEKQLPKLYETFKQVCHQLEIKQRPEFFILQSNGVLNAFAMRHAGRDFVVVLSDMLESYGEDSDEIRFILGHELGHIKSRHVGKHIFLAPASWLPLVGTAYSRACEASCDRYGAYVTREIEGAVRAMMTLAGGKEAGKTMSGEDFSHQHLKHRGFFISWYELISGYPTTSQRVANLISMKTGAEYPRCRRHGLSYLFAFLTFGGHAGGASNFFMTIFVVMMLVSMALPEYMKEKLAENDITAESNLRVIAQAAKLYAGEHGGKYPASADDLVSGKKKYLLVSNYCGKTHDGFIYNCVFSPDSFQLTATPVKFGKTGTKMVTVTDKDQTANDDPRKQIDADFEKLRELVDDYHKDNGQWPSDAKGTLSLLWATEHPDDEEPTDPYDDYESYGYRTYPGHYELLSSGPDEEHGTADDIIYRSASVVAPGTAKAAETKEEPAILKQEKLARLLSDLKERKIVHTLTYHEDSVTVHVTMPKQRWEIEFEKEGSFKIQKFMGNGKVYGETELKALLK